MLPEVNVQLCWIKYQKQVLSKIIWEQCVTNLICYNGMFQIHPQNCPSPSRLRRSPPPSNTPIPRPTSLTTQTASGSKQLFCHNTLSRQTDWQMGSVTDVYRALMLYYIDSERCNNKQHSLFHLQLSWWNSMADNTWSTSHNRGRIHNSLSGVLCNNKDWQYTEHSQHCYSRCTELMVYNIVLSSNPVQLYVPQGLGTLELCLSAVQSSEFLSSLSK